LILHIALSCERYLEIEGKPFKFEQCVETLHKVAMYNLLVSEELVSSDDAGAVDRNKVNGVMGGTLQRGDQRGWMMKKQSLKLQQPLALLIPSRV
jgi:hypothetical protein